MLTLSSQAIAEKNKLENDSPWLILVEINFPGTDTIRIYQDDSGEPGKITWNGYEWYSFPFDIDPIEEETKGQLPNFVVRICNIGKILEQLVDDNSGGLGASITLRVVHSDHLDLTEPELEETFEVISCQVDSEWVYFTLGAENPLLSRCPRDRFLKDHCRYKEFKGPLCGYSGPETECDRTFARCMELGNESRFGGFPGIATGGVYA